MVLGPLNSLRKRVNEIPPARTLSSDNFIILKPSFYTELSYHFSRGNKIVFSQVSIETFPDKIRLRQEPTIDFSSYTKLKTFSFDLPINLESKIFLSNLLSPATIVEHHLDKLSDQAKISKNLFVPITFGKLQGKTYIQDELNAGFDETPEIPTPKISREKRIKNIQEENIIGGTEKKINQTVSFFDLIKPILMPPIKAIEQFNENFLPPDKSPYPFQYDGIQALIDNKGFLLADEMGTGKTVMGVIAMRILFQKNKIRKTLIVCPVSLLRVWKDHIEDWGMGELITVVAHGPKNQRSLSWKFPGHVFITSYATYQRDVDSGVLSDYYNNFDLIIFDEAQNVKNAKSKRHRVIKKHEAEYKWALTGTPLENSIKDIIALYSIIQPNLISPEETRIDVVKNSIDPYMLRRLKKDVIKDLPPKTTQEMWMPLSTNQQKEYDSVLKSGQTYISSLYKENKVTKQHIFSVITKLKQICNFPSGSLDSTKANATINLIEEIISSGNKVLIFSQFVKEGIRKLESILDKYNILTIDGSMSQTKRNAAIDAFRKNPKYPIFLLSLQAAATGLTLTEASYVILFDQWWNPAIMRQAEDRVHRAGQEKPVTIYEYWIEYTIEQRIHEVLQKKKAIANEVVDSLATDVDWKSMDISKDEWLDILDIKAQPEEQKQPPNEKIYQEDRSIFEIREKLLTVSPKALEEITGGVFKSLGYPNTEVRGGSSDGGIDVLGTKKTPAGNEYAIIQCKKYNKESTIGPRIVRELHGSISQISGLTKGFLVTTSSFSTQSKTEARVLGIELIDGIKLATFIKNLNLQHLLQ